MDPLLIRPATADDLGGVLALHHEMAEGRPTALPAAAARARPVFEAILTDPARHLCVAAIAAQVVGSADLLVVANLTHDAKPWAVIENVIVTEPCRRQGIATGLLRHVIATAAAAGCYKVELMSGKQRAAAHALYTKLGFSAAAEGFKIFFDGTVPVRPGLATQPTPGAD